MEKILLVTSNLLPVPAVKGGAIETLIQILIEENELQHKAELYILCRYDQEAELTAKNYKYSHIIYYKEASKLSLKEYITQAYMIGYLFERGIKKITKSKSLLKNRYAYTAYKISRKYQIDKIIIEGGIYSDYVIFNRKYNKYNMYAHFHRVVHADEVSKKVYGNTISVSNYVRDQFISGEVDKNEFNNYILMNCANDKKFKVTVSAERREAIQKRFTILNGDFVLLFSGRIKKEKGVVELATAVLELDYPQIKLLIAGTSLYAEGSETEYMRAVREIASKSSGRIICTGYIPNDMLNDLADVSSAWCVPSVYEEPAGLVLIEAMHVGLPIIMTGSGGMHEYANEKCSIIAERDNLIDNLQKVILKLYKDPILCAEMAEASKKCSKKFTRKKFYEDFMNIFGKQ